jgi:hypothetical protein
MRRLFTLGLVLFVPLLLSAQIDLKVFFNTDQEDAFFTSDVRSLVFGAGEVHINLHAADAKTYTFAEFDSLMLDETPPVLSAVTTGTIESGSDVSATSDKDGTIYLVPDGTTVAITDFEAAVTGNTAVSAEATAGTKVVMSTTGLADGDYVVYAVDDGERISDASGIINLVTYYPPVLSGVTTGTIAPGDDVTATSDKDGTIYLVPDGTTVAVADFDAAVTGSTAVSADATAGTAAVLSTTGLADGDYLVYAVDDDERISDPSATIVILTTGLKVSAVDAIRLYPNPVDKMLYFNGNVNVQQIIIVDLLGKERIRLENAGNISKINATTLDKGIYFIKFSDIENSATYKFIKK